MENFISKKEVVKKYKEEVGVPTKEATERLNKFISIISMYLEEGNAVRIDGIGTFEIEDKKRNIKDLPDVDENLAIDRRSFLHFHPTPSLERKINSWRYWPEQVAARQINA